MGNHDHRVLAHLGLRAQEYDAAIRTYIPAYDTMIATVVGIVCDGVGESDGLVVDLGTGTGALAASILDATPAARVRLVDIDPAMLEVARSRVSAHGARAELVEAQFFDALVPCDAVVASLALHHVMDLDAKRELYRHIHASLRPGGVLAIADATVHADGAEHAHIYARWAAEMATHGIGVAEAARLFTAWAAEDRYQPLATELTLLADAGFVRPDCFWKHGPMTVFGGYR